MTAAEYQALVDLLIRDEGLRLKPYVDTVGKVSIGVGRNLSDNGISKAEALQLLDHDIERACVDAQLFPWFADLDPVRQRVILSLLFNLGLPRFLSFKHLIDALARQHYDQAAREMLNSQWARQVKTRAEPLADLMRSGSEA